ncbi:phosphotransferase [Nocardiopsis ansamitocini]|uniref:phosphotransferase n=1 Tax=Nocardiopsis ansamitocini TaxID=1670832 RepID=UPI0025548F3E|nr:phosphotransferase [Nocardiopsis ansamitocini]
MRERPADIDETGIRHSLREWGIDAVRSDYAPVGFGDHHWHVLDAGCRRWFVTVADLDHKEHCGADRAAALDGLRRAMDTAAALAEDGGSGTVVAPSRTVRGRTVHRLGDRYTISVFPFVEGETGHFGQDLAAEERGRVIDLLAELHRQTPPAAVADRSLQLPGRHRLAAALAGTGRPWAGGPYAEPARRLVAANAPGLRRRLAAFYRLAEQVGLGAGTPVVTHGEPHPGNLLWAGRRLLLVDWDTVGLALPERDLWLVAATSADLDRYAGRSGRVPDPAALAFYRLRWDFSDAAEFLACFRAPHDRTSDTERAWSGFGDTVRRLAADDSA